VSTVLQVQSLAKEFVRDNIATVALRDFNLEIAEGDFVTILGRSGCGKSTMLNLLSGLTVPSSGQVLHRGKPHTGPNPEIGYLTQSDTLMPWSTVEANVRLPMHIAGVPKNKQEERAGELIHRVGLDGFEGNLPKELSGGMRRRAGLARLLATGAKTILLDEPFGALDAQLKSELQLDLSELFNSTPGLTVVFVTHDIEEAILLGDRAVVLGPLGRILTDVSIPLERPRHPVETKINPEFRRIHEHIANSLREGAKP